MISLYEPLQVFSGLGRACRHMVLLVFILGWVGHFSEA